MILFLFGRLKRDERQKVTCQSSRDLQDLTDTGNFSSNHDFTCLPQIFENETVPSYMVSEQKRRIYLHYLLTNLKLDRSLLI